MQPADMKNLLLLIFCGISFCGFTQVHSSMPPEANNFYNKALPSIKPAIKTFIEKKALKLKSRSVDTDSLINKLKSDPLLNGINQYSIEAVIVLIMVQVSKNADTDLKDLVVKMRKTNEYGAGESYHKTEIILNHKSKMAETIAIFMNRIFPFQESAIKNLK